MRYRIDGIGVSRLLAAIACGLSALVNVACHRETAPPNLVLITVDTLRADHLQAYGYFRETSPVISRLADEGLLFENVIAPMATTLPSHASLMTSTYPARHGVLSNLQFFKQPVVTDERIQTAAQMLAREGYRTAAFTSSSPLSVATGIQAGFEVFVGPPPYETHQERIDIPAGETVARAIEWLESQAASPFFLWVHLFDPHFPYAPPEPYRSRFSSGTKLLRVLDERRVPPPYLGAAAEAINRYDGEILYTDTEIGKLLDTLRRRGLYDPSLIVFTADHGEGLHQHGVLQHGWIWNEQIRAPLIVRFPDGRRGREPALVSLIDVLPTLAGEAGLPLDTTGFDGINVARESRTSALSQREIRDPAWLDENFALTSLDWKYLYFENGTDILIDLRADPHETTNVLDQHPGVAGQMKEAVLRLVEDHRGRSPLTLQETIPPEALEQMRSLGYVD